MTQITERGPEHAPSFVGRERELALLLTGLDEAQRGRGGLFLIGGEPGIGKSRLADELSVRARLSGSSILWGRCWEGGGAPAYWPWVQCLRAYLRSHDREVAARHARGIAADLAQILPELAALDSEAKPKPPPDTESARFRLFDSTASFLRNAAHDEPLVLVVDDLQAADTPSLLLLRFIASQLGDARVVVVATYRDVEITPDHPAAGAITEMEREPTTRHLRLRGLGLDEVRRMARVDAGLDAPASVIAELHRRTNGNPLFVGEAMKLLAHEGGLGGAIDAATMRVAIPSAVREVITRRLGHVTSECRAALRLAAIIGPEVSVEAVRRLADVPLDSLLPTLDEAIASGLLVEVGGVGRYRFSHDLVREVLGDEIGAAERARLHLRAGEVLEGLYATDLERHLGEIAYHLFRALPVANPARVREFARRAAEHAARQLAYEEAVRLYRSALQAMEFDESADESTRCDLMLDLGDAQMRAGETARAKETFLGAAAIARRVTSADRLARAALGYGGRFVWARAANDRHVIPLLEEALIALGEADSVLRVRVLARLAGALRDQPQPRRRDELSRQAVDIARLLDDRATLAYALDGRFSAIWAPDTIVERVRIADEIVDIAEATGDVERAFQGHHYRLANFLELGDIAAARAELARNARAADELRQPAQRWYVAANVAVVALLTGQYSEAESLISEAFEIGREAESVHALGVARFQQYALRREQGRAEEMEQPLRSILDEYSFWRWMRVALLHLYTEIDRRAEARSLWEAIADKDFVDLPSDNDMLMGTSLLADVTAYFGDARRAELLHDLIDRYGHLNGYGHPEFATGSVARSLGKLDTVRALWDEAEAHFEDALEMNERMGALPWVARTQVEYAAMLTARGQPADLVRARALLDSALRTSRDFGLVALERLAASVAADTEPANGAHPPRDFWVAGSLTREGEYWTMTFAGNSFRLRDSKGLRYIAELLSSPGREYLALDLAREASAPAAVPMQNEPPDFGTDLQLDGAGPGPALDEHAKSDYRTRLHELQAELDEAESWHDAERAERARTEMDFLAQELGRAVGLGGRDRAGGSATERARLSVTRAIRLAMKRISANNQAVGDHLEASIYTGTYCAYRPDPGLSVNWEIR